MLLRAPFCAVETINGKLAQAVGEMTNGHLSTDKTRRTEEEVLAAKLRWLPRDPCIAWRNGHTLAVCASLRCNPGGPVRRWEQGARVLQWG